MVYLGMIFQYDSAKGVGLIMLSDGETKEFSSDDWIDTANTPKIGQKISYENTQSSTQIKVADEKEQVVALSNKENKSNKEKSTLKDVVEEKFATMDEYINYYVQKGFKLVKDIQNNELRTVTLRLYTETDYGEATISQNGSQISVKLMLNGKEV